MTEIKKENRRGWNFRRGAKDALTSEEAVKRGQSGGQAQVPKGFADPEVSSKAILTLKLKAKSTEVNKQS